MRFQLGDGFRSDAPRWHAIGLVIFHDEIIGEGWDIIDAVAMQARQMQADDVEGGNTESSSRKVPLRTSASRSRFAGGENADVEIFTGLLAADAVDLTRFLNGAQELWIAG